MVCITRILNVNGVCLGNNLCDLVSTVTFKLFKASTFDKPRELCWTLTILPKCRDALRDNIKLRNNEKRRQYRRRDIVGDGINSLCLNSLLAAKLLKLINQSIRTRNCETKSIHR